MCSSYRLHTENTFNDTFFHCPPPFRLCIESEKHKWCGKLVFISRKRIKGISLLPLSRSRPYSLCRPSPRHIIIMGPLGSKTVVSAILTWLAIRLPPSFLLSTFRFISFFFLLPSLGYVRSRRRERENERAAKHMTGALLTFFSLSLACALLKSLTVSCSETIAKIEEA